MSLKDVRTQAKIVFNQIIIKNDESFTVKDAFNVWYDKISKELITHKSIYLRCQKHIIKKLGSWQFKDLCAIDLIKIRDNYVFRPSVNYATVSSYDLKYIFKAFNLNSSTTNLSYNLHVHKFKKKIN